MKLNADLIPASQKTSLNPEIFVLNGVFGNTRNSNISLH